MAKPRPSRLGGNGSRKAIRRGVESSFTSTLSTGLQMFGDMISAKATRPAAHAGAIVFYNEMRQRVPVGKPNDGSSNEDGGTLFDSIYRAHSRDESVGDKQVYHIGPNKRLAPQWHFSEFGHWRVNELVYSDGKVRATTKRLSEPVWVAARPWITPTYDSKVNVAIHAMAQRMREKINEIKQEIGS